MDNNGDKELGHSDNELFVITAFGLGLLLVGLVMFALYTLPTRHLDVSDEIPEMELLNDCINRTDSASVFLDGDDV